MNFPANLKKPDTDIKRFIWIFFPRGELASIRLLKTQGISEQVFGRERH